MSAKRRSRWLRLLGMAAAALVAPALVVPGTIPVAGAVPGQPAPPRDLSAMVAQVGPSVVNIDTDLGFHAATGSGTGIVIDPNGVVLTNNHVVAGATELRAIAVANGQAYEADVLGYDRVHDVAVLQLRGASGLPVARIGSSAGVSLGDPVVAMGNVGGHGGLPTPEPGRVLALNHSVSAIDDLTGVNEVLNNMIKSDTAIRPGDSGGPLVNAAGEVIGMNTAATDNFKFAQPGGEGYAIPIEQAMAIANQIRAGNHSGTVHVGETGFLGVGVTDSPEGARVAAVIEGTPAMASGIALGDIIVAADGNPVGSSNDLTFVLDQHHPGDTVNVTWRDSTGGERSANIVLVPGPAG